MPLQARYVHTNLIAADWQTLALFYETVFGCVHLPPERDLAGPTMEAGTGLPGAHLREVHLRLPGYGTTGPTIEIFTYERLAERPATAERLATVTWHLASRMSRLPAPWCCPLAVGRWERW
jgi:hypothetical protein